MRYFAWDTHYIVSQWVIKILHRIVRKFLHLQIMKLHIFFNLRAFHNTFSSFYVIGDHVLPTYQSINTLCNIKNLAWLARKIEDWKQLSIEWTNLDGDGGNQSSVSFWISFYLISKACDCNYFVFLLS